MKCALPYKLGVQQVVILFLRVMRCFQWDPDGGVNAIRFSVLLRLTNLLESIIKAFQTCTHLTSALEEAIAKNHIYESGKT
jgi:hypothetical protein